MPERPGLPLVGEALRSAYRDNPALRALVEEQRALEDRVGQLKLRKDAMDPAQYDREMERLLASGIRPDS